MHNFDLSLLIKLFMVLFIISYRIKNETLNRVWQSSLKEVSKELSNHFELPLFMVPNYQVICEKLKKLKTAVRKVSFEKFEVKNGSKNVTVFLGNQKTFPSCTCDEWNKKALPCHHMFQVFKECGLSFKSFVPIEPMFQN